MDLAPIGQLHGLTLHVKKIEYLRDFGVHLPFDLAFFNVLSKKCFKQNSHYWYRHGVIV